jgi:8-oxo-dGTP pyrophosphatase MutT (NUDIX family)
MMARWQQTASRVVYRNPWISVREDRVIRPDGSEGIYGVVDTRTATAVVAMTPDLRVYLVGQYRYTMEQYSWEVIEGGGDPGEPAIVAAKRELKEEAGLEAEHWEALCGPLHLSNGYSSEVGHLFVATGLREVGAEPEATEDLRLACVPFVEALARVLRGEITDGMSILSLLLLERRLREEGRLPALDLTLADTPLPVLPNPWTQLSSAPKYENAWINVREDQVLRPDGNPGIYGVVAAGPNTNVVVQREDGCILLVGQHRYTTDFYSWELPGGGGKVGDDPLEVGRRELREEAGLEAAEWIPLALDLQLTNCHATDRAYIYLARGLREVGSQPDDTETIEYRWVTVEEALGMVLAGEIKDSLTMIGVLLLARGA